MSKKKSLVGDNLRLAAQTFDERNEQYGDAYKKHGNIISAFFPNGLVLKTPEDFNRYSMFSAVCSKMNRYAANFHKGGHADSILDATTYAAMLKTLDEEINDA